MAAFDFHFAITEFCLSLSSQRIPRKQWWLKLRPLLRILAKHDSTYEEEGMYITVEEECASDANII